MSVSVVAMEHALRLIADDNKVFYVYYGQNTTTKKFKFPYSGTVKFVANVRGKTTSVQTFEIGLYDSSDNLIVEKSGTSSTGNMKLEINTNIDKQQEYYFKCGSNTVFSSEESILVYADVIYGNQLCETSD